MFYYDRSLEQNRPSGLEKSDSNNGVKKNSSAIDLWKGSFTVLIPSCGNWRDIDTTSEEPGVRLSGPDLIFSRALRVASRELVYTILKQIRPELVNWKSEQNFTFPKTEEQCDIYESMWGGEVLRAHNWATG